MTLACVGSPLFWPNLLQNIDSSGQELAEMALKYYVVGFLPFATSIQIGSGKMKVLSATPVTSFDS